MSNIDNNTFISNYSAVGQKQLFTELTLEEGAVIQGGTLFYLGNKAGIGVNYNINGQKKYLAPNAEVKYSFSRSPVVVYDSKIGPGYEPVVVKLVQGRNNFDRNGNDLILGTDIVPNFNATPKS
ncbi:hypothetical protein [Nostoc sp. ChiQUE01b]|uniref:hypothetical protein n=1 Tax=Nostoc sp. ChiQUE01b TaxID=3075376 RepID=UPI002AD5263C|nr:hypothetical protein [Nostoc sp. ChiQUE01b]MDZ8258230.1 hypothetical protein [Nostoc sp. ChiQUE01b]